MVMELLKSILITSLMGSLLAVAITLIKPITKRRFGYDWHYYIWLAVLIVMVLPVRFTYPTASKTNILPIAVIEMPTTTTASPIINHIPIIEQKNNIINDLLYDWADNLAMLWVLGVFIVLSVNIIGYMGLMHRIHKNSVVISCPEIRKYTKRKTVVRVCRNLSSPFVVGIFRPSLILPDVQLSEPQLDNILMHEATHLNRNDILYKWFTMFVKALHWFNPFIYYVENQINTECEISCDLSVVKNMDNTQTADYVNTIISLLLIHKSKNIFLTTGMTSSKNTLRKRFVMIKGKTFVTRWAMIISVVSAILIFTLSICASGFLNGKWIKSYNNIVNEKSVGTDFNIPASPLENKSSNNEHMIAAPPVDNSAQMSAYTEERQNQADTAVPNTENEALLPEEVENPGITGFGQNNRLNFSSIEEAEQYLKSGGKVKAEDRAFKSGSNYIVDDYTFENNSNEKISNILCNDDGEVTLYFNANLDSLMSVSFTDAETKDEVNSAIILTGKDRIYKFTGLEPNKNYDVEIGGITEGEWKIEGQYIIF